MRKHNRLTEICKGLGSKYKIAVIDQEKVIYRDFFNGYDVEICIKPRSRATIYLWKDKREIVNIREAVGLEQIGEAVEDLYRRTGGL